MTTAQRPATGGANAMDDIDQHLLNEMQDKFPLVREPFAVLAERTHTSEGDVIVRLQAMRESGVLRQVSPIFDTKALGYATSLVAMRVPEAKLKQAAKIVNAHPGVSHNYRRTHEFNMWFTIAVPAGADLQAHVDALIAALEDLQRRGYLRRFAAILRHRKAGFGANGMAVWSVPEADIAEMGQKMAGYTAISHCYQRPIYSDWKYNLFTMIHARKKSECESFVEQLSREHALDDFAVLYSTTEYKKIRLAYFTPEFESWEAKYVKPREARR